MEGDGVSAFFSVTCFAAVVRKPVLGPGTAPGALIREALGRKGSDCANRPMSPSTVVLDTTSFAVTNSDPGNKCFNR